MISLNNTNESKTSNKVFIRFVHLFSSTIIFWVFKSWQEDHWDIKNSKKYKFVNHSEEFKKSLESCELK
jgi:hypothetical protein